MRSRPVPCQDRKLHAPPLDVDELTGRLDVILRADMVEKAKAGDKCTFTGTFIVVPDVSQLGLPGVNKEMMRENNTGRGDGGVASQGVTGLKALGVRDLQYKTAFLACHVRSADSKVRLLLFFGI
jgi:DNA replication licensing factor MCM6